MKLLVFGRTGQVATELRRQADVLALGRDRADLNDPQACAAAIAGSGADAVINAAAYTAVDRAEAEPDTSDRVNGAAPGAMARACAADNIPFLHISTDYVFNGSGRRPWRETDPVSPQNAYGRSKLAGERAVRAAGGTYAILRTSWVFSAHGANFVRTMLALSERRDRLDIVADQVGGPTPAAGIAATLLILARRLAAGQGGGTYHYAGAPDVSWAGFAREIFDRAGRDVTIREIATADYPTPAMRPLNSRLDCSRLETEFGIVRPDWRVHLDQVLAELPAH